ncbi:aminotransferase class I/II-fold pyridoxal phosphate-dependent enzyme [Leifsonia shinshuensis]|uniref:MalY/PatB family protein n=1 Tax=Leifsonia shinshuensis TaxID=150026 RepID=UPI001F50805C|nr:aminotransferase class I/II-fold pyridoxal phosphate-dependent enzyme [Leifsonia shinshuensis]MCI0155751.1 aminotransferase class I/II-fold pyridoxal phosphate-dependent enzyme [Leifsonia shinshuensis]
MSFSPARPLEALFASRSSIKWRRYPADVLPVFVAEMDFDVEPAILDRVADTLRNSDTGYLDSAGPLAPAFADFAWSSWAWGVDPAWVHLATDVTVGVVETLRLVLPESGGRVVLTPPVYPPFFEMIEEADAVAVTVPLREDADWALDLDGLERTFAAGVDAMLLCNPQNPTGRCHSRRTLEALARLAARYGVFVVSDEVHAPLAHPGTRFTPFAPVARAAGARSVTVTSASKAWNLAGLKCAVIVAAEPATASLLDRLPEELAARTSILGLHANVAALSCLRWRDGLLDQLVSNVRLLEAEVALHAPDVRVVRPDAGYLAWLDFRATGLGDDPARTLIDVGRVALNSGLAFGEQGRGFARINLACDPSTVVEAVQRIARTISTVRSPALAG